MASISQSALKPLCKVFPTKREKRYNEFKPSMQWQLCQQMQCTTFQLFTKLLKYSHNKVQICCKSFIFHFPHTHIICSVHVGAMAKTKSHSTNQSVDETVINQMETTCCAKKPIAKRGRCLQMEGPKNSRVNAEIKNYDPIPDR